MSQDGHPEGPLVGLRVADFSQAAMGPVAAEYLGWQGADVIKVEPPEGEMVRRGGRAFHVVVGNNLNKRGIVLELKDPQDYEVALRLIAWADVLIENFRSPEVMKRLNLGYEKLSEVNPRLIYIQSSAYGPTGPMYGMTSIDWFGQVSAGMMSVTGPTGGPPELTRGTTPFDWVGAFVNLEAILIALFVRGRTGRGMMVQTSQFQASMVAGTTRIAEYLATGHVPGPMGSARPNLVPDQAFQTSDGYITVSVPHNGFWDRFCRAIGQPKLTHDARFASNDLRVEHREILIPILEAVFRGKAAADWVRQLREADVPVGEFQDGPTMSGSLLANPQVRAEGLMSTFPTPWGSIPTAEPHWKFDKTEARITRVPPALGEHQQEVLSELGAEAGVH